MCFLHFLHALSVCFVIFFLPYLHLGFVHYVIHRSTWAETNYCYLEDLYVSPETRGQHIGKRLIEYVQKQAIAQQCNRLYWHTQETNHTAQKLYNWVAEKPGIIEYRMPLE